MRRFIILVLILLLTACAMPGTAPTATLLPPVAPTSPPPTATPAPTASTTSLPPTVAPTELPTATPQPNLRPKYELRLTLDYAAHTASVEEVITYVNQTGVTLNDLLLAVEPRLRSGSFELKKLVVNNQSWKRFEFRGHSLKIALEKPFLAGETIRLGLTYSLAIPHKTETGVSGYDTRQLNLVEWYPFIVPYQNGWILHNPHPFGEHLVYEAADFDVYLHLPGRIQPIVAASAPGVSEGEWTHYHLEGARVFYLSASDRYLVATVEAGEIKVTSYYFDGYEAAGQQVAAVAAKAIGIFSANFGAYPYPSMTVVETDNFDGLEGGSLFFLPLRHYDEYDGTWKNLLSAMAAHETAHAWWFGRVGSDQALEPWLDEALCMYSERIYFKTRSFDAMNWWWDMRVRTYGPDGWANGTIYDSGNYRAYTNATYRMGVFFLDELRAAVGEEVFAAFLSDYAQQMAGKIATSRDFFSILNQHTSVDYSQVLRDYFKP